MIHPLRHDIPEDHELRRLFLTLAERGMGQLHRRDLQLVGYLANMLTEFAHFDNMNRITSDSGDRLEYLYEMFAQAALQMPPQTRYAHFKHVGDIMLFNLGLFPERFSYGRRLVSPAHYAAQGKRSYSIAAESNDERETVVLRKLAEYFEECVSGLNWVKEYIRNPFFQYMLREFDVT
jgi:hypothetical protein